MRDSKNPTGPALRFTAAEWSVFTTGVKSGELDGAQAQERAAREAGNLTVPLATSDAKPDIRLLGLYAL